MNTSRASINQYYKKISGKKYYVSVIFAALLSTGSSSSNINTTSHTQTQKIDNQYGDSSFDTKNFLSDMDSIQQKTLHILKEIYHTNSIKVDIIHTSRTLAQQKQYLKQGNTLTLASLHLFSAACDFAITINGKPVTGTSNGWDKGNIDPFRYLGGVALEHGYFWGRKGDCGHVGTTESLAQFVSRYPDIIHDKVFQQLLMEIDTSPTSIQYQSILEAYDSITGTTKQRTYTGSIKNRGGHLEPLYHAK